MGAITMKVIYSICFTIAFTIIAGCASDCGRTDYGVVHATFYNNNKEKLDAFKVAVHPIIWTSFYSNPGLTSFQDVVDHYGAEVVETDQMGQIEIQVRYYDGATSCDGPRETYDNIFSSVVLFYECKGGGFDYQEFTRMNGLYMSGSINRVDSVFVDTNCVP